MRLKPIAEQVIVITGASSGIGLVTARLAAKRGATVMLVARSGDELERIVAGIEAQGGKAGYAVADVGDLAQVEQAARKTIERFGRIDTWVNNAGVAIYARLVDTPMAEHERLFRTNYFGVVHGALTAIHHLRRGGGALITVASIAADIPTATMGAYDASKHAVKGFIGSLRVEVMADRLPISVTVIEPSGIDTPIGEHAANHLEGEALIPPPIYDPRLVAEAILDAAQHSRRNVIVGGGGRLQVLLGKRFPRVLDRFGALLEPMLHDRTKQKTTTDNLFEPDNAGAERSALQTGRQHSLYGVVTRHPMAATGVAAIGVIALGSLLRRRS